MALPWRCGSGCWANSFLFMTLSALILILSAAFLHASWNLLAKRAGGGVAFVWAVAVAGSVIFVPINIALGTAQQVNWNWQTLLFLAGSGLLQLLYFVTLQRGYKVGDLSLVYPLARGTGPLFATIGAVLLLGERPAPLGILGAVMVVSGIFAISSTAPRTGMNRNWAIGYGLLTGVFIAGYTVWDKVAVSALLIPPALLRHILGRDPCRAISADRRTALARGARTVARPQVGDRRRGVPERVRLHPRADGAKDDTRDLRGAHARDQHPDRHGDGRPPAR